MNDPTVTFTDPDPEEGPAYICKLADGTFSPATKAVTVKVTNPFENKDLSGLEVYFEVNTPAIGTVNPTQKSTAGSGVAATIFTPSEPTGDTTIKAKCGRTEINSPKIYILKVEIKKFQGVDSSGAVKVTGKVTPKIDISLAELRLNNVVKDTLKNVKAGTLLLSFNQNDLKIGLNIVTIRVQPKGSDSICSVSTTAKNKLIIIPCTKSFLYQVKFGFVSTITPFKLSHKLSEHTWEVNYMITAHGKVMRSNSSQFYVDFANSPSGCLIPGHYYGLVHLIREKNTEIARKSEGLYAIKSTKSHTFWFVNKVWVEKSAKGIAKEMRMTVYDPGTGFTATFYCIRQIKVKLYKGE